MRFPGFEKEWEEKRFGDLVEFKITNSFSRENLNYVNGTVKNIHYGDIHTKFPTLFDITKEKLPYINNDLLIARISEGNYCQEGDIVFADASEDLNDVGKSIEIVNLNNEKLLSGLHTLLARPKKNTFHKGFAGYLLKSNKIRTQIQKESQGSKVLSISVGRISKIDLSFPSVPEQQKIERLLSAIDQRIQTQNKIIEKLETLIKGISEKLFGQSVRFKDNDELDFPKWKIKKLGEVLTIGNGKDYKHLDVGSIPVFGTGGLMTHVNSFLYEGETVCIGRKGTIDKPMYYKGKIWTVDTLFYTHSFLDVLPKFMFYVFKAINWKEHNEASGVPSLSKSTIEKIAIKIPCVPEQRRIAELLSAIEKKMGIERILLTSYQKQKEFLLDQLFI